MTTDVRVLPRRAVLDGRGCVWESILADKGWNGLPKARKPGVVVAMYTDETLDVHWPGLNCTTRAIFVDEVVRVENHGRCL